MQSNQSLKFFSFIQTALLFLASSVVCAQIGGAFLDGTSWLVEDIAGRGVIDRAQTTISFDAKGDVSGSTGCSLFSGQVTREREALTLGPLTVIQRVCVPALMDQELKFLLALQVVRQYSIANNGLLYLSDENGNVLLRLSRMPR